MMYNVIDDVKVNSHLTMINVYSLLKALRMWKKRLHKKMAKFNTKFCWYQVGIFAMEIHNNKNRRKE